MGSLNYTQWTKLKLGLSMSDKEDNLVEKNILTAMLLTQWKIIFTNIFKWDTSSTGNEDLGRHIENYLYEMGQVVFFKDKDSGAYGALPMAFTGGVNWYGEMTSWDILGANGFRTSGSVDDSVRMMNNSLAMSYFAYVLTQVRRLVNIEGTIDVNINQLKVPMIFSGSEDSLLTMKNTFKKIVENEAVVYVDKKTNLNADFKGVGTGVQYHGQELMQLYNDIEGRLLKIAGLKYVHTEKKERLVVDEVNSNDGLSNTFLHSALVERQKAVDKINEMFGLSITVEINPLLKQTDPDKSDDNIEDVVIEDEV